MKTYSLRELNVLLGELKFNRDTLEKVLRLSELLKIFNSHDALKDKYLLKGGTAINLCLFDFPRLSVDIDMDFNFDGTKDEMAAIRKLHQKIINEQTALNGYMLHPKSKFTYTLDSYLLQYTNAVGSNDYIKLELNYSNRVHVLEPQVHYIKSKIVDNYSVLGLDKLELYGSKISALIGRTTARDIFDVSEMIKHHIIGKDEIDMLRKISIFYLLLSNDAQNLDELINQFKTNINQINYHNIKRNLIPLLHVGTQVNIDELINPVIRFVDNLFILKDTEEKFINYFISGKYQPELLFDKSISKRLVNHPMALWKMMNYDHK